MSAIKRTYKSTIYDVLLHYTYDRSLSEHSSNYNSHQSSSPKYRFESKRIIFTIDVQTIGIPESK